MGEQKSLAERLLEQEPAPEDYKPRIFYTESIKPDEDKLVSYMVKRGIFSRLERHLTCQGKAMFEYKLYTEQ